MMSTMVWVSALLPSKHPISRGDPVRSTSRPTVVFCGATVQCVGVGVEVGWGQADLTDDTDRVDHRCRVDDPTRNRLEERVVDHVETQPSPSRLDQPAGPFRHDHRPSITAVVETEVEFLLTGTQRPSGGLPQRR